MFRVEDLKEKCLDANWKPMYCVYAVYETKEQCENWIKKQIELDLKNGIKSHQYRIMEV